MIYRSGPYCIDSETREFSREGIEISLQPQAFSLLIFLVENRHRVVSKDEVFEQVWGGRVVGDGTLNSRINAIRRAFGDDGATQSVIRTYKRQGFRFVAAIDGLSHRSVETDAASQILSEHPSIAVLPFTNFSDEAEHWYFARGLSEDINSAISRVSWLRVVSSALSRSIDESETDPLKIAAGLQVVWILRGSVRVVGDRVRVTAELVDGVTGDLHWSERYDKRLVELFDLQDSIANAIVSQVQPELANAEQSRASLKPPESLDAWGFFHRGMARMFDHGVRENKDHLALAMEDFDKSIDLDPGFSRPHTGRAFCHYYSVMFGYAESRDVCLQKGQKSARTAIELDPQDAQAYVASAALQIASHQPEHAVRHSQKAIEINPNLSQAYYLLGTATLCAGRPHEAISHLKLAIETGPHDQFRAPTLMYIGMARLLLGEFEEALQWAQMSLDLPNGSYWSNIVLTSALGHLERSDEAKEAKLDLLRRRPGFTRSVFESTSTLIDRDQRGFLAKGLAWAAVPE